MTYSPSGLMINNYKATSLHLQMISLEHPQLLSQVNQVFSITLGLIDH